MGCLVILAILKFIPTHPMHIWHTCGELCAHPIVTNPRRGGAAYRPIFILLIYAHQIKKTREAEVEGKRIWRGRQSGEMGREKERGEREREGVHT
jgi:hypothetical protein